MNALKSLQAELDSECRKYRIVKDEYKKTSEQYKKRIKHIKSEIRTARGFTDGAFSEREMLVLKNFAMAPKELSKILGVTPTRAGQIKKQVKGKCHHPSRIGIAEKFGVELTIPAKEYVHRR